MRIKPMQSYGWTNTQPPQCDSARPGSEFNPIRREGYVCIGRFETLEEATKALELYLMPARGNA